MSQLVIECENEEAMVLNISDDDTAFCADLTKLDADLKAISNRTLDYPLPQDDYDYDNHQWTTPKGKIIGEIFAAVEQGVEF